MSTSQSTAQLNTREQLIEGLQGDVAREYKAIQHVIFSQKLDTARYMNIADQLQEHTHQELDHPLAIVRQEQDHQTDLATAPAVVAHDDQGKQRTGSRSGAL